MEKEYISKYFYILQANESMQVCGILKIRFEKSVINMFFDSIKKTVLSFKHIATKRSKSERF